ncbi:hypothetical protein ACFFX0_17100 [Citricoccus parietis]|uniref:Uncharacterized protein n=1 Tax=Citricoccus parietis TaxID=592307 RepID=A0ABV5G1L4_9MICC
MRVGPRSSRNGALLRLGPVLVNCSQCLTLISHWFRWPRTDRSGP